MVPVGHRHRDRRATWQVMGPAVGASPGTSAARRQRVLPPGAPPSPWAAAVWTNHNSGVDLPGANVAILERWTFGSVRWLQTEPSHGARPAPAPAGRRYQLKRCALATARPTNFTRRFESPSSGPGPCRCRPRQPARPRHRDRPRPRAWRRHRRLTPPPSRALAPNEGWATDLCEVWTGRDGWTSLALVIDRHTRELLGWNLSRSGESKSAESALEQALIARYGCLGKVPTPFLLRLDNGSVFTSRRYTALVKSFGLQQEFITPYTPEQNCMVERASRTLKDECLHRHRFESLQRASRVVGDWIGFYNHRRPHQPLVIRSPAEVYDLSA